MRPLDCAGDGIVVRRDVVYRAVVRKDVQLLHDEIDVVSGPREVNLVERLPCRVKVHPHESAAARSLADEFHIVAGLLDALRERNRRHPFGIRNRSGEIVVRVRRVDREHVHHAVAIRLTAAPCATCGSAVSMSSNGPPYSANGKASMIFPANPLAIGSKPFIVGWTPSK